MGVANAGGDTPLHFAACRGSVAVAGMLLRAERNSKAVGTTSSGAAAADRGPAFHPLGEAQAGVTPPQAEVTPQTGVITPRSGGSERLLCLANTDGVTPLLAAAASGSHMCLQVGNVVSAPYTAPLPLVHVVIEPGIKLRFQLHWLFTP